jgi:hypothetical protein
LKDWRRGKFKNKEATEEQGGDKKGQMNKGKLSK